MDRYAEREKDVRNLVQRIKDDIKAVIIEKGYRSEQVIKINASKAIKFTHLCLSQDGLTPSYTLFFRDNNGYYYHSDNVDDIPMLLEILRAMYHLPPNN